MIAVVGWLLAVLQTVFAAPLWAVMHMTPDRTFVGSQTQGYLMLLSLFMRPVLIIAALFAAMALANPIILYVSKAFWTMRTANVSSAESIGFLVQFLTFKNWLIMYGMLLLPIVYMIFGLSNTLPDAILTWIGAGIKPLGETQATAEMRSGMERAAASRAAGAALASGGGRDAGKQAKIGNDKNGPDAGGDSAADSKPISDTGQASVSTPADYVPPDDSSDANVSSPAQSTNATAQHANQSTLSSPVAGSQETASHISSNGGSILANETAVSREDFTDSSAVNGKTPPPPSTMNSTSVGETLNTDQISNFAKNPPNQSSSAPNTSQPLLSDGTSANIDKSLTAGDFSEQKSSITSEKSDSHQSALDGSNKGSLATTMAQAEQPVNNSDTILRKASDDSKSAAA